MLNYMKSEWYRITHTKEIYLFAGILTGLAILMNIVLFLFEQKVPNFPYGTVSFSLSFLSADLTILFVVGAVIIALFFSGNKNGVLKNAIAFGISREKIFVGKSMVSVLVSVCCLIVVLIAYIGSAILLLEPGVAVDAVPSLLKGVACMLMMAVAFEVLAIALSDYFENGALGYIIWYLIMSIIPKVCNLIGLKVEFFRKIAAWMPTNYLKDGVLVNMSGWSGLWETPEGVAKCLISGVLGLVIFLIAGLSLCQKQEV